MLDHIFICINEGANECANGVMKQRCYLDKFEYEVVKQMIKHMTVKLCIIFVMLARLANMVILAQLASMVMLAQLA